MNEYKLLRQIFIVFLRLEYIMADVSFITIGLDEIDEKNITFSKVHKLSGFSFVNVYYNSSRLCIKLPLTYTQFGIEYTTQKKYMGLSIDRTKNSFKQLVKVLENILSNGVKNLEEQKQLKEKQQLEGKDQLEEQKYKIQHSTLWFSVELPQQNAQNVQNIMTYPIFTDKCMSVPLGFYYNEKKGISTEFLRVDISNCVCYDHVGKRIPTSNLQTVRAGECVYMYPTICINGIWIKDNKIGLHIELYETQLYNKQSINSKELRKMFSEIDKL